MPDLLRVCMGWTEGGEVGGGAGEVGEGRGAEAGEVTAAGDVWERGSGNTIGDAWSGHSEGGEGGKMG